MDVFKLLKIQESEWVLLENNYPVRIFFDHEEAMKEFNYIKIKENK